MVDGGPPLQDWCWCWSWWVLDYSGLHQSLFCHHWSIFM